MEETRNLEFTFLAKRNTCSELDKGIGVYRLPVYGMRLPTNPKLLLTIETPKISEKTVKETLLLFLWRVFAIAMVGFPRGHGSLFPIESCHQPEDYLRYSCYWGNRSNRGRGTSRSECSSSQSAPIFFFRDNGIIQQYRK